MTLARTASVECRGRSQMRDGGELKNEWELEKKSLRENFFNNFSCEVGRSQRVLETGRVVLRWGKPERV